MGRKNYPIISYILFVYCNYGIIESIPLFGEKVESALENEFPFIVSIGVDILQNEGKHAEAHLCGGALITRSHVLTSAHCIDEHPEEVLKNHLLVTVGTNDLRSGMKLYLESSITYAEWAEGHCLPDDGHYHDIAILVLATCIDSDIKLPKLSKKLNPNFYGKDVITAGWGEIQPKVNSLTLNKVNLHILTHDECVKILRDSEGPEFNLWDRNLCTKINPSSLLGCGDSGSPLLINGDEIIGINDSVCPSDRGDSAVPLGKIVNVHIGVGYYTDFIQSVTKGYCGECCPVS